MLKKIKISQKALQWGIIFGFLCSVFWSFADFDVSCEELRHNVLRLHIVANSDSDLDQEIKLEIRNRILEHSQSLFSADADLTSALAAAQDHLEDYEKIANGVIKEYGQTYTSAASIGNAFFETRVYEEFTLPSGSYPSLIINLGEGKGKNWWCVIFPAVCLPANGADLDQSVAENGVEIAENGQKYVIRFKTVELYEKIKKIFQK